MVLRDKIIMDIIDKYKEKNAEHESVCVVNTSIQYELLQFMQKKRIDENFYIKSITNIPHKNIPIRLIDLSSKNTIKKYEGIYEIRLSNDYMIYYFNIENRNNNMSYTFLIGELNIIKKFIKSSILTKRKTNILTEGIYEVNYDFNYNINIYTKHISKITSLIHPQYDIILHDINFYFNNLKLFKRYNNKGIRKILLAGEPGTGKSSILNNISIAYKNEKNIAFTSNISTFPEHMKICNDSSLPCIIILEDADSSLTNSSSDLLNFLDGYNQPNTKCGCYVIMSTNNPNLIDDRIKKRPGRIDKIFNIDNLKGNDAIECAKIYFKNIVHKEFFLKLHKNIFDNMTGAQIKELSQSTASFAAANNINIIDLTLVTKIKDEMFNSLNKIDEYCTMNSIKSQKTNLGFTFIEPDYL